MSVYLLIAIALSAMSAVTEIPDARPRIAHVSREGVRAERRAIRVVTLRIPHGGQAPTPVPRHELFIRAIDALTGAATPRAPSFSC